MLLGDLLARFNDPLIAEQALASLDDLTLVTDVTVKADAAGLSTGAYAAECVETYADTTSDEEWTTLMGQMGRTDDPGSVLLRRALAAACSGGGTCGCGGHHR
ncbi:hypothetical protein [Phreatobacter sp.]|uniref:hypothetical protein n=1 Tax=Phreatobacter sp. TaxID=1966341 RepID=UPI003F6FFD54